jgi:X-Pro dipeptidyl-peptidase
MVAAAGDVPGLAAIVPIAAINHWYGYAYQDGVRYLANSENPADEGFDTPLGFDFGFGRTPPDRPLAAQAMLDRMKPCDAAEHTERAYATDPRYDAFWLERDYRKDAARFRVPAFVVHGWQDYNVKQSEGVDLFEAIPVDDPATPAAEGVPFKLAHFHQAAHDDGGGDEYDERLEKFFARTLKGEANGIELEPAVRTQTRSGTTPGEFERTTAWPPPGTGTVTLRLGDLKGTGESFTDTGATTEESALASGLAARPDAVAYVTEPLAEPMRLAGSAVLRARVTVDDSAGHLNATLADVAPDGSATAIARGHHNIRFRDGLAEPKPIPAGEPVEARVRMSPQDQTVEAGHSLGLIVTGSNVAWAVPVTGRRTFALDLAGSRLELPVVGAAQSPPPALTRKPRLTVRLRRAGPGRVRVTGVASPRALLRVTLRGPRRVIVSRRILVPPRGRYKLHLRVRARRVRAVVRGAGLVARSGVIRVRVPTRCGGRRRPSRPRGGSGGSGRPKARCRR